MATLPDDIFKYIFVKENVHVLIHVTLKVVSNDPLKNNPALRLVNEKAKLTLYEPMTA